MAPHTFPLTEQYVQQAREAFRSCCLGQSPPALADLFAAMTQMAQQIAGQMPAEHVIALMQEHPQWVFSQECFTARNRDTIAGLVADHLIQVIRRDLNTQWALVLLHVGKEQSQEEEPA